MSHDVTSHIYLECERRLKQSREFLVIFLTKKLQMSIDLERIILTLKLFVVHSVVITKLHVLPRYFNISLHMLPTTITRVRGISRWRAPSQSPRSLHRAEYSSASSTLLSQSSRVYLDQIQRNKLDEDLKHKIYKNTISYISIFPWVQIGSTW